jgi:hypothetical protein|tara:strand:- start:2591 stop:2896 length:306 start_codon:yes stop_codon:yes gene_type:complete
MPEGLDIHVVRTTTETVRGSVTVEDTLGGFFHALQQFMMEGVPEQASVKRRKVVDFPPGTGSYVPTKPGTVEVTVEWEQQRNQKVGDIDMLEVQPELEGLE